jgi:hypothetical protein
MPDFSPSRNQRMRLDDSLNEMQTPEALRAEKAKKFYQSQNDANMQSRGMSEQGKDVLGGLASLLPGSGLVEGAKRTYDRAGQLPGMVGAVTQKIEDNYYTPEMKKMGIEPDPRLAALKGLSQDNEKDFQNAKDYGGELAMSLGGRMLGGLGKGVKRTSLDMPDRISGKADELTEKVKSLPPIDRIKADADVIEKMKQGALDKYGVGSGSPNRARLEQLQQFLTGGSGSTMSSKQLEDSVLKQIGEFGNKKLSPAQNRNLINAFFQSKNLGSRGISSSAINPDF